jgi:phenylpropionate dioxygenase-like ring-hydroxylating dioxygenase large terminal subunit
MSMGHADHDLRLRHEAQRILNTGLRDLWYPVAASWQVTHAPIGVTRLSESIVLWRDGQGSVHALEDRCPHRGARLSLGWNLGERLACWYHGIQVDGQGKVCEVPASARCPMEGQHRVKSYPVHEAAGAIFLWFGNEGVSREPVPLRLPEELTSSEHSHFLCMAYWTVNYRYAIDNVMDPMHGAYLHATSHSMAEGDKRSEMRVRKTPAGLIFEKVSQRDVNFDWVEMGDTGALWLRLSIPYRKRVGPGGSFGIVGFATPVDESHCQVFFWRTRKVHGWQRHAWRFLYRNRLEALHWQVLEQDRVVLESMPTDAREREFLYEHDVGLARVRRLMEKRASEQAVARLSAQDPAADRAAVGPTATPPSA